MNERRGHWYLFTGLIIGVGMGLLYSWVMNPVSFVDTAPSSLHADYKADYRSLIALAYQANNDIGRARQRLGLLGDRASSAELSALALQLKSSDGDSREVKALARLSADLQNMPVEPMVTVSSNSQAGETTVEMSETTPSATPDPNLMIRTPTLPPPTPRPTFTQRPTLTPRVDFSFPFILKTREAYCDLAVSAGLLQIEVQDASGQPVPGVPIRVSWDGGGDTFYTGLHPKISNGYADFVMQPDVVYSLSVADGGETIRDLESEICEGSQGDYQGGIKLVFTQP